MFVILFVTIYNKVSFIPFVILSGAKNFPNSAPWWEMLRCAQHDRRAAPFFTLASTVQAPPRSILLLHQWCKPLRARFGSCINGASLSTLRFTLASTVQVPQRPVWPLHQRCKCRGGLFCGRPSPFLAFFAVVCHAERSEASPNLVRRPVGGEILRPPASE